MEKIRADRLVLGYAAGLAGTVPMTIAMDRLWRLLPERQRYPLPPREIMAGVVPGRVQEATSERGMRGLTLAAHFAFGGAAGALLGALPIARRHETGAAYGVLIWTVSYMGWIPALRILKPAIRPSCLAQPAYGVRPPDLGCGNGGYASPTGAVAWPVLVPPWSGVPG